jgi:glucose uptake protein GlcU
MTNAALPWFGVFGAIVLFGCFAVPMKAKAVKDVKLHPLVFQTYVAVGVCLSSLPVMLWSRWSFDSWSNWAFLSSTLWTCSNLLCVLVVDLLGVSVGQGLWSGAVALVSFVEGLLLGQELSNVPMAVLGMVILISGIVGLALVSGRESGREGSDADKALAVEAQTPEDQVEAQTSECQAPTKPSKTTPAGQAQQVKGFVLAFVIGLFGGSIYVPLRLTTLTGIDQVLYSVPFGFGALLNAALLQAGHFVAHKGFGLFEPMGNWEFKRCVVPCLVSGVLWNGGNICSILAQLEPLGLAVGYPLTQCCILVGGLWGIFYYREIQGRTTIALFFLCTAVLLVGASTLGVFSS